MLIRCIVCDIATHCTILSVIFYPVGSIDLVYIYNVSVFFRTPWKCQSFLLLTLTCLCIKIHLTISKCLTVSLSLSVYFCLNFELALFNPLSTNGFSFTMPLFAQAARGRSIYETSFFISVSLSPCSRGLSTLFNCEFWFWRLKPQKCHLRDSGCEKKKPINLSPSVTINDIP